LTLLNAIIASSPGGYRVNDARYLAGAIHWRAGRVDAALRVWRGIQPRPDDSYYVAASRLLAVLDAARAAGDGIDARQIVAVLESEQGRWLLFSVERLHRFGFRFDTY
jgi:hypothetical protein